MNFEKHISELLFEHDCVIVPEFGGFVCNYASAGINPTKHMFNPPYKKISFNRNLRNNDGLLANLISQENNISYSDSNKAISNYVALLNNTLRDEKRFDFKSIGVLFAGEENTLHFEQDLAVNYLQESFGLTSFYFPAIKREPLERKIEKKLKNKTIIPSKEKKAAVPVKRRISRVVLSAAAILLVSFFVWLPLHSDLMRKIDYSSLNPFASKPQPRYQPAEIALPDVDVTKADVANLLAMASDTTRYLNIVINGSIPIVIQLKEDATTVVKSKKKDSFSTQRYHVVGGAFAISENAEKFHQKLTKAGYQASIIDKKGKTLRFVSYGGYATKEEAMQALEKIRSVQGDAWLMIN